MSDHPSNNTTFAVTTLGCKVNQADSEAIGAQMNAAGFVQRNFDEIADVYIVNTCTVTHLGDRSSRQMIAQAHRRHPDALLVVTGCYAELNPKAVAALPGVDLVVGNQEKDALIEAITQKGLHAKATAQTSLSDDTAPIDILTAKNRSLPMLPLDTQHIGSDGALSFDLTEAEPVADNPPSFSPFRPNTQLSEQTNARMFSHTRVQMKVQDGCDNRCT
jgi:threonylcarbamoyladenosine tRNA methylthiotransferase MtaB